MLRATPTREMWTRVLKESWPPVAEHLSKLASGNAERIAEVFYAEMMRDPESAAVLDPALSQGRLRGALERWVRGLYGTWDLDRLDDLIAQQRLVGLAHARAQVGFHLVMRGARVIREEMRSLLLEEGRGPHFEETLWTANALLDLAVEEMAASYDSAQDLIERDVLTGTLSRRRLAPILAREMEYCRKSGHRMALLIVDVDGLRHINEAHGRDIGDRVLQAIGATLRAHTGPRDFVFRFDAEEFLCLLGEVGPEDALAIAHRLQAVASAARVNLAAGGAVTATASVGVAAYDGDPDPEHLVTRVERALLLAKSRRDERVAMME